MNKYICTNRNRYYKDEVEKELNIRKKEILNFFLVKDNGTFDFNIYIYDTVEELHSELRKKGIICNDISYQSNKDNSLYFVEPNDNMKEEYKNNIFYEEFKEIEHLIYGIHPKWLSDGLIMYIDNQIDIKTIIESSDINEFIEPYKSYIIVSYLIEKYSKYMFLKLIGINDFIKEIENSNIIVDAIKYYINKYKIKIKIKK